LYGYEPLCSSYFSLHHSLDCNLLEVQGVSRFVRGFQCKHLLFSTCDSKEEQQNNKAEKKNTFLFVGVDIGFASGLGLGKFASLRKTSAVS